MDKDIKSDAFDYSDYYDHDTAILKKFRDDYYRIVNFKVLRKRTKNTETEQGCEVGSNASTSKKPKASIKKRKKIMGANEGKMYASLARSKARIREIAICNDWEYFITMTIDGSKHSRDNLGAFRKKLSKWLNNYNSNKNTNIKYLLIPETHKDRTNWHLHGLLMGLPCNHLTKFSLDDNIPHKMRKLIQQGRTIYNWTAYAEAFGWVSAERINSLEGVAHYITKYITKRLGEQIELNNHVYFCSKGLKRAVELQRGRLNDRFDADYVNEHLAIKTVRGTADEALGYFEKVDDST